MSVSESGASVHRHPLPTIIGDKMMLTQLYQNLIGNALKFCDRGKPEIHLTAEQLGGAWTLGVKDNGIGLKPEYAERIFQPFQRLHSRSEYTGTGIGLAICKKTVQRHGGEIYVESQPGEGAHFKFSLISTECESEPCPTVSDREEMLSFC